VQLINPKVSSSVFDAVNAPIYQRGTQPGQWQPMNEEPQEEFKNVREGLLVRAMHQRRTTPNENML
jgi:hypothetical protein